MSNRLLFIQNKGAGVSGASADESRIAWIVVKVLAYIATIATFILAIAMLATAK